MSKESLHQQLTDLETAKSLLINTDIIALDLNLFSLVDKENLKEHVLRFIKNEIEDVSKDLKELLFEEYTADIPTP